MQSLLFISTILVIHVVAWLTPGPLFVLIIRNSLVYSRKTGIWTAVGIAFGNVVHITYSVVGITLVFSTSVLAFSIIKFCGVLYLAYLGIKTLSLRVGAEKADTFIEQKDIRAFQAVKIGFFTNILSPNASLFFASIFATVLSSDTPFWMVFFLMVALPFNSFFMALILSIFFTQRKVRSVYVHYQYIVTKLLGVAFILFAAMTVLYKG